MGPVSVWVGKFLEQPLHVETVKPEGTTKEARCVVSKQAVRDGTLRINVVRETKSLVITKIEDVRTTCADCAPYAHASPGVSAKRVIEPGSPGVRSQSDRHQNLRLFLTDSRLSSWMCSVSGMSFGQTSVQENWV